MRFGRSKLIVGIWTAALLLATTTASLAQDAFSDRTLIAQARLTRTLVDRLQTAGTENVVVSPAGIASALALLDLGTSDGFREASRALLGYGNTRAASKDLEDLRDLITQLDRLGDDPTGVYSFANAAVFDPRLRIEPTIVPRMRETRADVSVKSLADHATVVSINDWVAKKTRGLIPDIVDDSIASARVIVLNALYFKDDWAVAFNPSLTKPTAFHDATGAISDVPMMQGTVTMPFRSDGRFAAVDLQYKSGRFSLVLATTRDRPATFAEFASIGDWLSGDDFMITHVRLQMPRFTLRQTVDVLPALDAAGLATARRDPAAFRPMTSDPVDISAILQKTYLGINERGTEAAAVTSVTVRAASLPPKNDAVTFDKPFVFALRDRISGLILLSGYIGRVPAEPTQ